MSSLKSSSDEKQRLGIVFESIARGSIVDAGPERISDAIICWIRFGATLCHLGSHETMQEVHELN